MHNAETKTSTHQGGDSSDKSRPFESGPQGSGLRIGLLLDSLEVRAWVYEMLETILAEDLASVELLIVDAAPTPEVKTLPVGARRIAESLARRSADMLTNLYLERDRSVPSATALHQLRNLLPDTEILEVATRKTKHSDYLPDEAIEQIRDHDLDILFRVGFRILRGGILHAAKHGVWSYHHGDDRLNRGGPPCFWEVNEIWPEVGSMLQKLDEELDNGLVLYRSTGPVFPYSLHNTRNRLYWKSSVYLPRVLKELNEYPDTFYERVAARQGPVNFYSNRLYKEPTPFQRLGLAVKRTFVKMHTTIRRRLNLEQWILLFHLRPDNHQQGPSTTAMHYHEILPPQDRIWADPHVVARNGKFYVYLEELLYSTMKGHISVMEIDSEGNWSTPVTVLEKPYHLSYPFIMEEDGELWMVPESKNNMTVDLYRCSDFPFKWEHHTTLIKDQGLVDSTLYFHEGRWWLFANIESHREMAEHGWDELHLFYADDFRSNDWTAHPLNPIVSDLKCSRPAGPLFIRDGKLYRPSQNCSYDYGYGISISEIHTLSTVDYGETVVDGITPDWQDDIIGTHSITHARSDGQTLSVLDAFKLRRKWSLKHKILNRKQALKETKSC